MERTDFWTKTGMGRVEGTERVDCDIHITICKRRWPVEMCWMTQGAQIWCSVTTEREGMGWKAGSRGRGHMSTYG